MRVVLWLFSLIFLLGCLTNSDFAEDVVGFELPAGASLLTHSTEFYNNPTGDGQELAIFSFHSDDSLLLATNCIKYNYLPLPVNKEKLPDGAIYQWISTDDSCGYYKLNIDPFDSTSYSLAVVNLFKKRLIVYRVFY